ncbi:MAG: pyruvate kinase, partial [Mesorhizobium sp.]
MRRSRKVKILATIGPASSSEDMLKKLFEAGADVFRINMSHTDHELMHTLVGRIRAVEKAVGRPIGILADLQGPKLRVGKFASGKEALTLGQTFTLDDSP